MPNPAQPLGDTPDNPFEPPQPYAEVVPAEPRNDGRFRKGVPGPAWRHGGRSRLLAALALPELAEGRALIAERTQTIISDLGGDECISVLAAGQIERHARLELIDDYLWQNIFQFGVMTGKGHTRAALNAWLTVVDRLQRSAMTLGLERRPRRIPTLAEVMSGQLVEPQPDTPNPDTLTGEEPA